MMVNAAVFTCSICGEASLNICSYCTKDACSNHRCERCKRCSDCCECEFPLSADEPVVVEEARESVLASEFEFPQPEAPELEAHEPEAPAPLTAEAHAPEFASPRSESSMAGFLTPEESSVFAEETVVTESKVFDETSVFVHEEPAQEEPAPGLEEGDVADIRNHGDPTEPHW
jgi:hypothetical protein